MAKNQQQGAHGQLGRLPIVSRVACDDLFTNQCGFTCIFDVHRQGLIEQMPVLHDGVECCAQ
jgi:hypothetical protein